MNVDRTTGEILDDPSSPEQPANSSNGAEAYEHRRLKAGFAALDAIRASRGMPPKDRIKEDHA